MGHFRKISFCPHCGNNTPQESVYEQPCKWSPLEEEELQDLPLIYYVATCGTCNHLLLYSLLGEEPDEQGFIDSNLEFPARDSWYSYVPQTVLDAYAEAARIKLLAPNGFVNQIGRALEALCDDRGARGGALHNKIKDLLDRNELPATLALGLPLLKGFRNVGSHNDSNPIKLSQVDAIDKFFRAVVEYVYVAPSMLKALEDIAPPSKSK
jgi:hypothetical protein